MLVSQFLKVVRSLVVDPSPGTYWTDDGDLLPYLNQFQHLACGLKPDLYPMRATVQLTAGTDQVIPADGLQFLDAYYVPVHNPDPGYSGGGSPNGGNAVFVYQLEQVKHSKFANMVSMPPVDNVQVVCADPRNDKGYFVFPPSTGTSSSLLRILYGAFPPYVDAITDPYYLPAETTMAATDFILSRAYRKGTDRQDLQKSEDLMKSALSWFPARDAGENAKDPKPDA